MIVAARRACGLCLLVLLTAACQANAAAPTSMASLGDSLSVGLFTGAPCGPTGICPVNNWSTGTSPAVNSHFQRLRAIEPRIADRVFNDAVSARRMIDLARQARVAVGQRVQYVTILMGLNDLCRENEAAMTPVATFRAQFAAAMDTLSSGLPGARVFVASIPDVDRVRELFVSDPGARSAWAARGTCTVYLQNAASELPADQQRRARVRQRLADLNRQLAEICARHRQCVYDGGAVSRWDFGRLDIVTLDYFHLSVRGQAALAALTYPLASPASGGGTGQPPPPPCLLYTSPSPRDRTRSRMPSSA